MSKSVQLIKDHDVKWIDLRFTDTKGTQHHVTMPARDALDDADALVCSLTSQGVVVERGDERVDRIQGHSAFPDKLAGLGDFAEFDPADGGPPEVAGVEGDTLDGFERGAAAVWQAEARAQGDPRGGRQADRALEVAAASFSGRRAFAPIGEEVRPGEFTSAKLGIAGLEGVTDTETHRLTVGGRGGVESVREVEFLVQALQLIRGGRIPSLQQPSLLLALQALVAEGIISTESATALRDDYLWLRQVEQALQGINDQQTQTLPQDELAQAQLLVSLGIDNWAQLQQQIDTAMARVHQQFKLVIDNGEELEQQEITLGRLIWDSEQPPQELASQLDWLTLEQATELIAQAIYTIIKMLLVLIVPGLILGIVVAVFQAATSIQEQTLTFLPRMLLTLLMVVFAGHWLIKTLLAWFANLAQIIPGVFG